MERVKGIIAAAATPLHADFTIDHDKLVGHCRRLLDRGCNGINLLGTTGEATSFSVAERLAAMQAVAKSGLPLDRFLVGTGAAALADAVALTGAARELGFAGALLLPPFYYKGIDDGSLAGFVETVIDRVGPRGLRLYLYHFPQNSGVPYPPAVVERLHRAHPDQLLGVKDSSGDLPYARGLAKSLPDLDVFPSAEGALATAKEDGFAGCISATANITVEFAARGWATLGTPEGAEAIREAAAIRAALTATPVISATKWALSDLYRDESWRRLAPPLRALTETEITSTRDRLGRTRYSELCQ
ncbi:MAG TPA: dihydrodipicolinate synthase family protein [Aliidongia sp.]|nr:dihydrodipicolinate synthase family protein [Aliidongia sp.]